MTDPFLGLKSNTDPSFPISGRLPIRTWRNALLILPREQWGRLGCRNGAVCITLSVAMLTTRKVSFKLSQNWIYVCFPSDNY